MKRFVIAAAAVLTLGVLGVSAARHTGPWSHNIRAQFLTRHLLGELNLNDEQRAAIKTILQREKPAIQSIATQLAAENEELRTKTTFDEAFVRQVAARRNATLTEALVEREKVRAEIYALLTPEQRQTADRIAADIRGAVQDRLATLGDQL